MTLLQIKAEIASMTFAQKAEVARALGFDDDDWDIQMREDAAKGKLDFLLAEAESECKSRNLKRWPKMQK